MEEVLDDSGVQGESSSLELNYQGRVGRLQNGNPEPQSGWISIPTTVSPIKIGAEESNVSSKRQCDGAQRHNVLFRVMKYVSLLWSQNVSTQISKC